MLIALLLGYRRIWVWGWQLTAAEEREKQWRDIALKSLVGWGETAQEAYKHTVLTAEQAEAARRIVGGK